ncbi:MAG: hypothetical protein JKY96_01570, partial [Phycisphaerales bacterium]|nr:hypothetical protein [Phycisphaerales bacterium]
MNPRRAWTWVIFWAGVCIVLATLGWASYSVYQLETRNAEVQAGAQRQELIRLALWRIDSRIAPIIALEASRPYTEYEQLQISPDDLFRKAGFAASGTSPFSGQSQSFARQYFQYDNEEEQDPQIALSGAAGGGSNVYSTTLDSDGFREGERAAESAAPVVLADSELNKKQTGYDFKARKAIADIAAQNVESLPKDDRADEQKSERARGEYGFADDVMDVIMEESVEFGFAGSAAPSRAFEAIITNSLGVQVGGLTPQWMIGEDGSSQLVLVRTVTVDGKSFTQGVWLDWPALNADLIDAVEDILPASSITSGPWADEQESYPLATIPASFMPGGSIALPAQSLTPAMIAMAVTWLAIIIAIAAIGLVLRAAIQLSERRGRFVTAVTDELRTPL